MSNIFQSLGLLVLRISIKRTFDRNTNVVRISIVATCFPLRGKYRKQYVQANWIFRSVATLKSNETPFRAQRDEAYQRPSNNAQYTVVLPPSALRAAPPMGSQDIPPLLTKSRSLQIAILVSQSLSLLASHRNILESSSSVIFPIQLSPTETVMSARDFFFWMISLIFSSKVFLVMKRWTRTLFFCPMR